jgi:hypothetical protein
MKIVFYIAIVLIFFEVTSYADDILQIDQMTLSFHSDTGDKKFINYIKNDLMKRLERLDNFYGVLPPKSYKIYLLKNGERFDSFSKNDLPKWSRAIAYAKNNTIVLKINSAEDVIESSKTIVHELSHMLLYYYFKDNKIPVWINEGLAEHIAGKEINFTEKNIFSNALWGNDLISLNRIDSLLSFDAVKARLAYLESLSAVEFFINKHGEKRLYQLLGNLKRSNGVNNAFIQTVGYDFIDFELEWYQDLDDKYYWMAILNCENMLWTAIMILVVVVFIVIKIRNKKKLDAWDLWEE